MPVRTTGLVLALAGVDPEALAFQGRPPFVAVRPCGAISIITGFVLVPVVLVCMKRCFV